MIDLFGVKKLKNRLIKKFDLIGENMEIAAAIFKDQGEAIEILEKRVLKLEGDK